MTEKTCMDEQLNVRCFYLRLVKKAGWIPLAAVLGLVAGAVLYSAVTRVTQPVLMESDVQLYLHFVENASGDKVYDYYNAYTWNDLLRSEGVRNALQDPAVKETARAAYKQVISIAGRDDTVVEEDWLSGAEERVTVTAEQPSDIRVLWVRTRAPEAADALQMSTWMAHALVKYGEENEVFRSIEITQPGGIPRKAVYPERFRTAMAAGAVTGALLGLFVLLVLQLLDEAVYVPEEAEKRYGLPVVAVMTEDADCPELLMREAKQNLAAMRGEEGERVVLTTADGKACEVLSGKAADRGLALRFLPPGEQIPGRKTVLLGVQAGKKDAALTAHLLSQARAAGLQAEGIVLTGADGAFLKRYYRL